MSPTREPRRLGLHHFAFYRAFLEGSASVDLNELGDRYLGTGSDPRRVRATLRWLQDELTSAARRASDHTAARLLRLPKSAMAGNAAAPADLRFLTLEDFRQAHDPDNFYTEAELLVLYREAHPELPRDRKAERNARLNGDKRRALSSSALAHAFGELFNAAAIALRRDDPSGAQRLAFASAHWLRHIRAASRN